MSSRTRHVAALDVVEAYDRIAPELAGMYSGRKAYFEAIDGLVIRNVPAAARSMLDVGCGNGARAEGIAKAAKINELVLMEPSAGMRRLMASGRGVWTSRIEELVGSPRRFEVITCLWNVLGHVPSEKRVAALRNMRTVVDPDGLIFLDVQSRYNAREYGWVKTAGRWIYDAVSPSPRNGDVTVCWKGGRIVTTGHVFTRAEMLGLIREAGLQVRELAFVDYRSGEQCGSEFAGSMFFVLSA
jgi:SAM-dependent methyltransferase